MPLVSFSGLDLSVALVFQWPWSFSGLGLSVAFSGLGLSVALIFQWPWFVIFLFGFSVAWIFQLAGSSIQLGLSVALVFQ